MLTGGYRLRVAVWLSGHADGDAGNPAAEALEPPQRHQAAGGFPEQERPRVLGACVRACLVGWLTGSLAGWLAGRLGGQLVCWLVGWPSAA